MSTRRRGRFSINFFAFVGLILLVGGAFFFSYEFYDTVRQAVIAYGLPDIGELPVISAGSPQPTGEPLPNISAGERVNVLVLGIDRRPTEKCPCRTDTMILTTLDPKTSTAGVLTIPRDLYVPIPGVGENRINTAMFYGDLYKSPGGGGPGLAKKTIEYNFGRTVHYYVLVDFSAFIKVVDTLGGIDIDVPKAINDPQYPDMDFGFSPLYIPAGRVHMNGELALKYARTRHVDGDFGRSKRQIQVLMAVRDKALRLDILPKLPGLVQSMWGTVETDLKPQEILALSQAAVKIKTENIKTGSIDQTMTVQFRTSQGADVLWFDRAKVGQLFDQIVPPENVLTNLTQSIRKESARITVLNGTNGAHIAEQTAKYLQAQGFQIAAYGNADRFDYPKTILYDYTGTKAATMSALSSAFHVDPANVRRVPNTQSDADIRVIIGADWTLPTP